jgi:fumarate reductase flavoprotein subunit
MNENDFNWSRRKFITASSAAIAAPIVMNMTGKVTEAMAAEKSEATSAEKKTYLITDNCVLCPPLPCKTNCPVKAISFDGDKFVIDTEKCIRCGTCVKGCEIGAIVDVNAPLPTIKPHDTIQKSCDMVVVGGGASGLIAAAIAADMSKKKVIVLEKARNPGGSGFYAQFIRFFSTKWQRDAGVPDQMDDYIRSAMNITRWQLNPQLVTNAFHAIPGFFDWFCTWGKPEEIFTLRESRSSKKRKSIEIQNADTEKTRKIMHRIIDKCMELGVEILTEHSATEFIMSDNGEVTGVVAKDPGGITIINCKYCLVSTGNLINNSALIARSVPDYVSALKRRAAHRLPTNNGDGVLMAEKAGIPVDYNSICITYTGINATLAEPGLRDHDHKYEALYVNLNGRRWINESYLQVNGNDFDFIPTLLEQPKCMFYTVMDSNLVLAEPMAGPRIITEGNGGGRNVEAGVPDLDEKETGGPGGMLMPGMKKLDLNDLKRIASWKGRHVVIADTLEELADKMGVDRKTFVATVKRYNELCAKGRDDDYLKPAKYMIPIEKGPFYASSHFLGMDGAVGGLAINENMQVMGKNGPIKNLYSAGDTTGGRYINRGGERIEIINDMSWAVASGFLAGQNIGKQLKTV